ncbi:hypothetical protein ACWEF9_39225, partial [Streptomyces sp. NPDC004980]
MYRVADQRPASGGTAVVAAVLALLGGIAGVVGVVFGLYKMVRSETGVFGWGIAPGWVSVVSGATLLVDVVSAVALLVGAILAFRRRAAGPTLVVLGSAGTVGAYVVTAISTAVQLIQYDLPIGRHIDVVLGQSVFNGLYSMERNLPWVVSVLLLVFPVPVDAVGRGQRVGSRRAVRGGGEVYAVDGISLSVEAGQTYGLVVPEFRLRLPNGKMVARGR